ncbi:MAG: cbb3-type cytochrome c oxidase subunit I [Pseudomonadales bacterium]
MTVINALPARQTAAVRPADDAARTLGMAWLWLAVAALLAAGLMSLLLALARTPLIQQLLDYPTLFRVALVVHVDLSALIWFFACAGLLWTLLSPGRPGLVDRTAVGLMAIGTLMIATAPLVGRPLAIINNYVPVLEHPWFFLGLGAATAGLGTQAARYLQQYVVATAWRDASMLGTVRLAMALTAAVMGLAIGCVALSWLLLPAALAGEVLYDLLFWGGGHVLQFAYTLLLLSAWLVLLAAGGACHGLAWRAVRWLLVLTVVPLAVVPWLYTQPLDSPAHVLGFTALMRWGGLASLPLGALALWSLLVHRAGNADARRLRAVALCSMGLFAAGGLLGFLIRGSNTMIPAHYHGAIVAVTLAAMGLIYVVLPGLGHPIKLVRVARWQPWIYASGQLMHITGLAWCGGYGVQRKVAGAAQGIDGMAETAGMALMGIGALVSVAGGVMFLVVVLGALISRGTASPRMTPGGWTDHHGSARRASCR